MGTIVSELITVSNKNVKLKETEEGKLQLDKEAKLEAKAAESERTIAEAETSFGTLFITPFKLDSAIVYTEEETKTLNGKRKHYFKIMKKYLSDNPNPLKNSKEFLSALKDDSVNDLVEYWESLDEKESDTK